MNEKNKLQQALSYRKKSAFFLGISAFFALLSPSVFIALCGTRRMNMSEINYYGLIFVAASMIISIISVMYGLYYLLYMMKFCKEMIVVDRLTYERMTRRMERRILMLLQSIVIAVIFLMFASIPFINIGILRESNPKFKELNYYTMMVLISISLGTIVSALVRFFSLRKLQYRVDESIPVDSASDKKEKRRRRVAILLVSLLLVTVVCVGMMRSGTWYIQPYISTIPYIEHKNHNILYDKNTGTYTIRRMDDEEFRILQLTDIHLGGSFMTYKKDLKALQAVYDLIAATNPDLVVVTGDFVFPLGFESFSFNNYTPVMQFASFMRNIGIPWALTYGNHDTEFIATHTEEELDNMLGEFCYEKTGTLLYSSVHPDISGRSNQMILIQNADGQANQALFLIDSNSYASGKINDYDFIHDDQVDWYRQSVEQLSEQYGKTISSLLFTHIPLQEFKTAYDLYQKDSEEVTYYFGKIGEANEAICCSQYSSKLFDTMVDLNSTKGVFVGHDHYNNISLEYKGIRLTYGMSIDYLAMPGIENKTEQRGGTLITLHNDSSFDIKQIKLTEIYSKE